MNIDIQSLFSRAQDGAPPFRPVHNPIVWRFEFCEFSSNTSAKVESSINCKTFLVNQLLTIWIVFTLGNNTNNQAPKVGVLSFRDEMEYYEATKHVFTKGNDVTKMVGFDTGQQKEK